MSGTDSRRKRGLAYQRWCKQYLEKTYPGCVVHNQPMNHFRLPNGVWACRSNDIFGCIDLIAIFPTMKPLFIQCTLDEHIGRKQDDLARVPWNFEHCDVQVWMKRPSGLTTVWSMRNDGFAFSMTTEYAIKRGKVL